MPTLSQRALRVSFFEEIKNHLKDRDDNNPKDRDDNNPKYRDDNNPKDR